MTRSADRDVNRALRARFDEVFGQYERLRSGLDELQQRLAAFETTATSDDGHVTATVGPRGELVRLALDPRVYRHHDADGLAHKITTTVRKAAAAAAVGVQDLVRGYLPAGTGTADFLQDGNLSSLLNRGDATLRRMMDDE